jgi:hypothetical protein
MHCETHEENSPTNSMKSHALPTVCLGPTGNFQGSYNFLNLVSGLVIKHSSFIIPAPQSIITHVNDLAAKSGVSTDLIFANQKYVPFSWDTPPKDTTVAQHTTPYPYPDIPTEMLGVMIERNDTGALPPIAWQTNDNLLACG